MIKLSDHIFWQPTRMSADSNNLYVFALSTTCIVCLSVVTAFHLFYVIMAEKNHAVGRQALHKGIAWFGALLVAFANASLAALDVAFFFACHYATHLEAIFEEKILNPVITPAVNRAVKIYNTTYDHVAKSPNAAKSYLRELVKDEKRLQQVFTIFCGILIVTAFLSSLYLQLLFSGLLSQDDLHYVFRTYFISISTFICLVYGFYLRHAALIPEYVLKYLVHTAATYWNHLIMMANLDKDISSVPQTLNHDILLHLGQEMPDPEELLTLHLRSQIGFDFDNQDNLDILFGDLRDYLALELPFVAIGPSDQFAIPRSDGSIKYRRKSFGVMEGPSLIGFFHFAYTSLRD